MTALSGMKEITAYVRRSESTVLTLIREFDFPAKKICGVWESDTEVVDNWRRRLIGENSQRDAERI